MAHRFQYLVAIFDVASRKVLAWRLSNTLTTDFCVEALEEALAKYGRPEIFNTDQGSQFTSDEWIDTLKAAGVAISMDGKGRWIDNVFIERLWRSVKCQDVYLRAYANGSEVRAGLSRYFTFHNARRSHQTFDYLTPDDVYFGGLAASTAVAASRVTLQTKSEELLTPAASDRGWRRRLTKIEDEEIIINTAGRSTYPEKKSV